MRKYLPQSIFLLALICVCALWGVMTIQTVASEHTDFKAKQLLDRASQEVDGCGLNEMRSYCTDSAIDIDTCDRWPVSAMNVNIVPGEVGVCSIKDIAVVATRGTDQTYLMAFTDKGVEHCIATKQSLQCEKSPR